MDKKRQVRPEERRDETLRSVKAQIQEESRRAVESGALSQTDLFLIRPEVARRAVITLKA